jgi:hemolysin III
MGWTIVFFFPRFVEAAPKPLFWLIFAGGMSYTGGAFFYAKKGFRYYHMVWHLCVLAGAACSYIGIVFFMYA